MEKSLQRHLILLPDDNSRQFLSKSKTFRIFATRKQEDTKQQLFVMDSSAIGKIGTAAVATYLSTGGYIDPHINSDDTIAMWDGYIFVYKTEEDFCNKNFDYQIPVQVKAEEIKNEDFPEVAKHPVPIVHLEKYQSDGGVVFFKVLVHGSKNKIYVSFLTREKIGSILSEIKDNTQTTKTIILEQVPEERNVLLEKLERVNLHRKHECVDLNQLSKWPDCKLHFTTRNKEKDIDVFTYLATHYVDVTVSSDILPGEFVVKNGPLKLMAIAKIPSRISINGNVYYNSYTKEYTQEGMVLRIGNSCTLKISYETDPVVITINLTLQANSITEIINETKFLIDIAEYKYIQFNNFKFQLSGISGQDEALKDWIERLRFWTDVQSVFKMLHVPQTLQINNLSDDDYNSLNTLISAFVYNKHVLGNIGNNTLFLFEIQNLKIAVLAQETNDGELQLCNVYDLLFASSDELGERHIIPTQSALLGCKQLPSNMKLGALLNDYKRLSRNDKKVLLQANNDLLRLLNHYDRSNDDETISVAYKLSLWLKNDKSGIIETKTSLLNYLQTAKRKNKTLKRSEIRVLESIIPANDLERFAINALKGNIEDAKHYFDQLSDSEKRLYVGMPIFHFINDANIYNQRHINS